VQQESIALIFVISTRSEMTVNAITTALGLDMRAIDSVVIKCTVSVVTEAFPISFPGTTIWPFVKVIQYYVEAQCFAGMFTAVSHCSTSVVPLKTRIQEGCNIHLSLFARQASCLFEPMGKVPKNLSQTAHKDTLDID